MHRPKKIDGDAIGVRVTGQSNLKLSLNIVFHIADEVDLGLRLFRLNGLRRGERTERDRRSRE